MRNCIGVVEALNSFEINGLRLDADKKLGNFSRPDMPPEPAGGLGDRPIARKNP
jgi:hypothetical protein